MEFRHQNDIRYHVEDVIRGYPVALTQTALRAPEVPDEERQATIVEDAPDAEEGRTLVGYPVVFDTWTEIQSWDGPFMERITSGAADKTLSKRAERIQLMFNHGFDFMLEQTPIGRHQRFEPDTTGVYNEAALIDRGVYDKLDLVVELIRIGAIFGQSFRFRVDKETWVDEPDEASEPNPKMLPERTIEEFSWFESGPVTYPAYEATTVSLRDGEPFAVRSRDEWQLWVELRGVPTLAEQVAAYRRKARDVIIARGVDGAIASLDRALAELAQ